MALSAPYRWLSVLLLLVPSVCVAPTALELPRAAAAGAPAPRVFCAIGASVTLGIIDGPGDPYIALLEERLAPEWEVRSWAMNGLGWTHYHPDAGPLPANWPPAWPLLDALEAVHLAPLAGCDVVYPMVGVGDALVPLTSLLFTGSWRPPPSKEEFRAALHAVLRAILEAGVPAILLPTDETVGTNLAAIGLTGDLEDAFLARLEEYADAIRETWRWPGVVPGPDLTATMDREAHYNPTGDPLHPTAAGHAFIADAVEAYVEALP